MLRRVGIVLGLKRGFGGEDGIWIEERGGCDD
jgi:hypothetical protein